LYDWLVDVQEDAEPASLSTELLGRFLPTALLDQQFPTTAVTPSSSDSASADPMDTVDPSSTTSSPSSSSTTLRALLDDDQPLPEDVYAIIEQHPEFQVSALSSDPFTSSHVFVLILCAFHNRFHNYPSTGFRVSVWRSGTRIADTIARQNCSGND
jgi:hypothetical protein